MTEIVKKELDFKDFKINTTEEDSCFVDLLENEIKLENAEGKLFCLLFQILLNMVESNPVLC